MTVQPQWSSVGDASFVVRGTEICPSDSPHQRLQKLARITLDEMFQLVGVLDTDGTLLECNRAALEGGGLTRAEVIGKPFWETMWWTVTLQTQSDLRDAIARAARGEFVRYDVEVYARKSGKEIMMMDFTLLPVRDETGRVVYLLPEGRDITEKKAREREIAQKNVELQGLLERIRELDEIKTQFFANVSHELRTPLALILGPAQRLIAEDESLGRAERRQAAEVIARNARMLLKHVNDLLDMSRLDAGKLKIDRSPTDVAELLRLLASHFAVLAAERSIEYVIEAPEVCVAAVDPDKLQRVLMNLLGNAFKFVPDAGRVRCSLQQSVRELSIVVEDSGPGVKPELRQAIFERFRQGDGGSTRQVGGTGLGLAIARELVELHKGRIEVLDSPLGGARFQLSLPMHREAAQAQRTELRPVELDRSVIEGLLEEIAPLRARFPSPLVSESGAPSSGVARRPRVLVVEDSADMNQFVCQCLSRDYQVISAADGREGLEKAIQLRPALVVSDIMMPRLSGAEMISRMRAVPELRETPVLVLSAKADEELMVQLLEDGAQDYVIKPFSERELCIRVRNLVVAQLAREQMAELLTRERRSHEESELTRQRLHSLFTQAPTLIAILRGPEFVVELANPPMCQIWGRPAEEVVGRPLLEVLPELREQEFPELLERVFTSGIPHLGQEVPTRFERRPGQEETLYFNFVYSPFRNIDGHIEGIFVVASDVTAEAFARTHVNSLREAAESASRAKDEFFAILGHELRNPLSPIRTALEVMKLEGVDGYERARTVIERQVDHLTRLVDDLLDVSRIARGKVVLEKQRMALATLVASGIELASPRLEQAAHTLEVEVPRDGLDVDADPTRIGQVIENLLSNAAKYTPSGGHISVRAVREGNDALLCVRDTGIGIAPESLPRVFDLFVQERQAMDRSQGGLGIGLAIVRNLVELHGGSVTARSEGLGRGSELTVRLPLASRAQTAAEAQSRAGALERPAPGARATRLLIVDDNEDAAEMLSFVLGTKGYETRIAYDGPTALRVAAEFEPDIALLDIGLPVMDGYELAARLRQLPQLAAMRLVAVTGYGQESDRRRTSQAGFHRHLVKPVRLDALEAVVTSLSTQT